MSRRVTSPISMIQDLMALSSVGFDSVATQQREGRSAIEASGHHHAQYHRARMIAESREHFRNNGIYTGMINKAVGNLVGNGFVLQARSADKGWNSSVEKLWKQFWHRPEVRGLQAGHGLGGVEQTVCRELLLCGDTAVLMLKSGLIQLIEAEQIAGGETDQTGIVRDQFGKPTKFYVCPWTQGRVAIGSKREVRPQDILFVAALDRPSSVRGVPPCQSMFPMLRRISSVCDSEALAWQVQARLALSITRQGGGELGYAESEEPAVPGQTRVTDVGWGLVFHGNPGDEIRGIDRTAPGKSFPESLLMFLRLLGLPLGLPLEEVIMDWSKSNYSQSKAVFEVLKKNFEGWQSLVEEFFYRPLLEWKVREWMARGQLEQIEYEHEWIKPRPPWIDVLKESEAQGDKVERGFASHASVCKSLMVEREDVIADREAEVLDAIRRAQEIEKQTGVLPPWQMFAGMKVTIANTKNTDTQGQARTGTDGYGNGKDDGPDGLNGRDGQSGNSDQDGQGDEEKPQ